MKQRSLFPSDPPHWTVTELTRRVRQILEQEEALQDVWVQGEISNLSRPSSGHIYMTLKDSGAALKSVMWKSDALRLHLPLRDGMLVEAHGKIGVYEPGGQYQLYMDILRPAGEGALFAEFLRLKAALEAEGLFDPQRKRPIPELPRKIGIVTSPTGAAIQDMLHTLSRRLPLVEVFVAPAAVQGEAAPAELVRALGLLNTQARPDVILLARGGGSIEDLWAFNDERVVRAVAASQTPIICGVGHETDFTLADFAADLRAPTPTAAAELATPITTADLKASLQDVMRQTDGLIAYRLEQSRAALGQIASRMKLVSPARRLANERQRLDELTRRMERGSAQRLKVENAHLRGLANRLEALNPLSILRRGYAVVTLPGSGNVVLTATQAPAGTSLNVQLSEGRLIARVEESDKE